MSQVDQTARIGSDFSTAALLPPVNFNNITLLGPRSLAMTRTIFRRLSIIREQKSHGPQLPAKYRSLEPSYPVDRVTGSGLAGTRGITLPRRDSSIIVIRRAFQYNELITNF